MKLQDLWQTASSGWRRTDAAGGESKTNEFTEPRFSWEVSFSKVIYYIHEYTADMMLTAHWALWVDNSYMLMNTGSSCLQLTAHWSIHRLNVGVSMLAWLRSAAGGDGCCVNGASESTWRLFTWRRQTACWTLIIHNLLSINLLIWHPSSHMTWSQTRR